MYDTWDFANGVGLAGTQINRSANYLWIDSSLMLDEDEEEKGTEEVFIHPNNFG